MQTFFHSEPRIEEWVNEIIDNIFKACQSTGVDSEAEFQKGSLIVTNLTRLLQGIATFPIEHLEDALKQLLEQKIPESPGINFPAFQVTMKKMLQEGMKTVVDTQKGENEETLNSFIESPLAKDNKDNTGENEHPGGDADAGKSSEENFLVHSEEKLQISEQAKNIKPEEIKPDHLKTVLSKIFPNVPVRWNPNLMGQTFLAQVEDILICLHDPKRDCNVQKFNKEGWKVFKCSSDDLLFPRRLEREIRKIRRVRHLA